MRDRTPSGSQELTTLLNGGTVDESIERMASRRMADVVSVAEGEHWMIGAAYAHTAADWLVSRMFTDAVFSDDIRSIQLIINRIDGGLPKDVDVDVFRTQFGDCLNEVMSMTKAEQVAIDPNDTVMMALCKNLYQMATADIYWDPEKKRKRRPTEAAKKERDAALRMVLERAGGRKTLTSMPKELEDVEIADWIAQLPESTC